MSCYFSKQFFQSNVSERVIFPTHKSTEVYKSGPIQKFHHFRKDISPYDFIPEWSSL